MKHATSLLSLYILALAFVTCSDSILDSIEMDTAQYAENEKHSHSEGTDLCSPFCFCQCCQSTADVFHFSSFELSAEIILLNDISSEMHFFSQEVLISLYQPPIV